jgi:WD40 repeat protein
VGSHAYSGSEAVGRAAWEARGTLRAVAAALLASMVVGAGTYALIGGQRDRAVRDAASATSLAEDSRREVLLARASTALAQAEHDAALLLAAGAWKPGSVEAMSLALEAYQGAGVSQHWQLTITGGCRSPAWLADGTHVACASPKGALLIDGNGGEQERVLANMWPALPMVVPSAVSPVGALVTGRGVRLWNLQTDVDEGALPLTGEVPTSAAWAGDVLVVNDGKGLQACSRARCRQLHGPVVAWAAAARGRTVVAVGAEGWWVLDVPGGKASGPHQGPPVDVSALALSADGTLAVAGGADGSLWFWGVSTRQLRVSIPAHRGAVDAVAVSAPGKVIASSGRDGSVAFWFHDGTPLTRTRGAPARGHMAFNPQGVLVLEDGRRVRALRAVLMDTVPDEAEPAGPTAMESPCSTPAAASGVQVCGLADGTVTLGPAGGDKRRVGRHATRVLAVATSVDGAQAVSASNEDLRFWDPASGALLAALPVTEGGLRSAWFSGDGRHLFLQGRSLRQLALAPLLDLRDVAAAVAAQSGLGVENNRAVRRD